MTTPNLTEPHEIGTVVRIRDSGYGLARIVEYRGPLGPDGARIYRVCVREKPRPAYTEVRGGPARDRSRVGDRESLPLDLTTLRGRTEARLRACHGLFS